jgi:3-methyladenine DNA glycosylase AlkD
MLLSILLMKNKITYMNTTIEKVRLDLVQNVDAERKKSAGIFFKEAVKIHGVKAATVHRISKDHFKELNNKNKPVVFGFCEELWLSGYLEESIIACNWSYYVHKQYRQDDFEVFEKWVNNFVTNWASCDTLCNHSVGRLVEMHPSCLIGLKKWAMSQNRWMRRAAAVSLIIPARHGKFLNDMFEIANILLTDKDDMVRKGYGWMLKAASEAHQQEVFDYVMRKKSSMPRTALRYSIEKMPAELKALAMAKPGDND